MCDITIVEIEVFSSLPSASDAISELRVGGVDVTSFDDEYTLAVSTSDIKVYHKNAGFDKDTIFLVDYFGEPTYLVSVWCASSSDMPSDVPSGIPSGVPSDVPSGVPSDIASGIPTPFAIESDFMEQSYIS